MFVVCGLSHKTAPLSVREACSIPINRAVLQQLRADLPAAETAILSTCNRTEIYCANEKAANVLDWLTRFYGKKEKASLAPYTYTHEGTSAISHLLRVASGLDSMVLGEPQILGQLKQAFQSAADIGTTGAMLNRLFQYVFAVAKTVRTQTGIGQHPVSIAYAAVQLVKQNIEHLAHARVLLIGAGQTNALVARYLQSLNIAQLTIANRDVAKAVKLAEQVGGQGVCLSGLSYHVNEADLVISATDAGKVLLTQDMLRAAQCRHPSKPMLLIDLSVPRNIEPACAKLPKTFLYTVDDLNTLIHHAMSARQDAAIEAEALISLHTDAFMAMLRRLDAVSTICDYRNNMQVMCDHLTEQAHQQIAQGQCATEVIDALSTRLRKRLLHAPTVLMRQLGEQGDWATLDAVQQCFGLKAEETT